MRAMRVMRMEEVGVFIVNMARGVIVWLELWAFGLKIENKVTFSGQQRSKESAFQIV